MAFIEVKDLSKVYTIGERSVMANDKLNFEIEKNEFAIILGASGAGKSTFLNILGGLDTTSSGDLLVDGKNIAKYSERELTTYRRYDMGFVFQFYNLIPNLTALETLCCSPPDNCDGKLSILSPKPTDLKTSTGSLACFTI